MEKLSWEIFKQVPNEYKLIVLLFVAIIAITVWVTLQTVKMKELIKFVEKIKEEPHKCVNKNLVAKIKENEYKIARMAKEIEDVKADNNLIKLELKAIRDNTANIMEMITSLNNNVIQVALKNNN